MRLKVSSGYKNWPANVKVEKMEIFENKFGLQCCMWYSLNAPGTRNPLSHPFLKLGEFPFSIISPLASGVIRNGPQYESEKDGNF